MSSRSEGRAQQGDRVDTHRRAQASKARGKKDQQSVADAASQAVADVLRAKRGPATSRDEIIDSLGEREQWLVREERAPLWSVRAHGRIGHIGGALLFVALMALAWPIFGVMTWAVLQLVGIRLVTQVPEVVLGELSAPAEQVASTTDRFVFGWYNPVLYFVIFLAVVSAVAFVFAVRSGGRAARRLALGLFAGYGSSPLADHRERRARRAAEQSEKTWAKLRRGKELAASRKAVDDASADSDAGKK